MPSLFSHFKEERVSPILFASEWFTTMYGYTFDLEFTTRVWTVFFHVRKPWLFRVAMGILRVLEKQVLVAPPPFPSSPLSRMLLQLMKLSFERIILLLKVSSARALEHFLIAFWTQNPGQIDVMQVIDEADRHEAINDKMLARLSAEASKRTTAENLI